jgi:hypothetical protein
VLSTRGHAAVAESVFSSLAFELEFDARWYDVHDVERDMAEYIDVSTTRNGGIHTITVSVRLALSGSSVKNELSRNPSVSIHSRIARKLLSTPDPGIRSRSRNRSWQAPIGGGQMSEDPSSGFKQRAGVWHHSLDRDLGRQGDMAGAAVPTVGKRTLTEGMSTGSSELDAIAFFERSLGEARAQLAALAGALAAGDRLAVVTAAFSLRQSLRTARDHLCTGADGRNGRHERLAELEARADHALEDARTTGLVTPEGDRSSAGSLFHREGDTEAAHGQRAVSEGLRFGPAYTAPMSFERRSAGGGAGSPGEPASQGGPGKRAFSDALTVQHKANALPSPGSKVGPIPGAMAFPHSSSGPGAPARTFGTPPLTTDDDLQALGDRMEAERLLTSKDMTSGQDAMGALDILLGQPTLVDKLSQRAFDNLIDRLSEDQRARMAPLVDASQDPKRKLKLWAAQHKGRARDDLRRYEGDLGDPDSDEQTDVQAAAQQRHGRRRRGVESTESEVDKEVALLAARGDKLTVKDLDEVRARKDKELDVEIKHNINLVAEGSPRDDADKTRVIWSQAEVAQLDASLSKLPDQHVRDASSPERYIRRANRALLDTRGGEYQGNEIDIFDHAHDAIPGRAQAPAVEYAVTHEVGHEAETENRAAFAKFEKTAGWQRYENRDALEKRGLGGADIDQMGSPHKVGDKVFRRNSDSSYHAADEAAIPSFGETNSGRWKYAATNAQEHWAELYAMAVEMPDQLYSDYVGMPAERVRILRETLAAQRDVMQKVGPGGSSGLALTTKIAELERALVRAEKVARQRRSLYDIIRNDVLHGDKNTHAAVERLKKGGASNDALRAFEDKAARVSTPQQIAELEREATR